MSRRYHWHVTGPLLVDRTYCACLAGGDHTHRPGQPPTQAELALSGPRMACAALTASPRPSGRPALRSAPDAALRSQIRGALAEAVGSWDAAGSGDISSPGFLDHVTDRLMVTFGDESEAAA